VFRETDLTGSFPRFAMRSLKIRVGTAANLRTSTPSIPKSRSGTAWLPLAASPPNTGWPLSVDDQQLLQAGDRFGLFGSIGSLESGLMPVERRAVDLALGRPAPRSPVE
jgi:hypothetical protein